MYILKLRCFVKDFICFALLGKLTHSGILTHLLYPSGCLLLGV